jgi:hypothetical protein
MNAAPEGDEAMSNGNWLRRKATDATTKGLFRAARQSDYPAALALLDRLSETGHGDFSDRLRQTVAMQGYWSEFYKARFVSWRVQEYMSGARS